MGSMFRSARFKLTLFFLAIILAFSLSLTYGTRWLAEREYVHNNVLQRSAFRNLITRTLGVQLYDLNDPQAFSFQHLYEMQVRAKLDRYIMFINLGALVLGGIASWKFAGRTLKPIEEAHEAQKRFASDASHELRTPLTVMRSENEVFLRQKDYTKEEAREVIQSNLEEVERLERLAKNLLQLTKYEDAALDLEAVAIQDVVAQAVEQAKKAYPDRKFEVHAKAATVLCQPDSLVELMGIIIDNACKYSPAEKPITITGKTSNSSYAIAIADKGKGIDEADLPYIFDRLYRSDKARSSSVAGHGLGLALAKRIAAANHGAITAHNARRGGAIFTVSLRTK